MSLYDNAFPSNYEEIRTFYPVWYFDVKEMDAVWRTTGKQLDAVQSGVEAIITNNFIATADDTTLKALEKFLGLTPNPDRTSSERRQLIASVLSSTPHIGAPEIKDLVGTFTLGDIDVSFDGGEIRVTVTRDMADRLNMADCLYVLQGRIPAHLDLMFTDILRPIPIPNAHGTFRLEQTRFAISFSNVPGGEVVLLDGRRNLDGSWLLNQTYSGMRFQKFAAATSFQTPGRLTATVTRDSWWELDGSVLLDGSRKLDAQITKEDI